jgi:hypothetical protein
MKVLIGVPMGEQGRHNQFHQFLNNIRRPDNTETCMMVGRSAAENRNLIIEQALEKGCTHVLFLDDDMAPNHDILFRLLGHGVPIVTGVYYTRKFPHQPVLFSKFDDDNVIDWYKLEEGRTGLVEVAACGLGACLIETHVFREMLNPWIRYGEIGKPDSWCHDIGFFRRARREGYVVWCDLDCCVGHIGEVVIRPHQNVFGSWSVVLDTGCEINIPRTSILETV